MENFYREKPAHCILIKKLQDKLHPMLATDLADQVDSIPVVSTALAQFLNTLQKGCGSVLTVVCPLSFWVIKKMEELTMIWSVSV